MLVLIVDDQADFREAASTLLEAEGFDVMAAVEDGAAAVAAVEKLAARSGAARHPVRLHSRRRRAGRPDNQDVAGGVVGYVVPRKG